MDSSKVVNEYVEVSGLAYNAETKHNTYNLSRIEKYEDGSGKVKDFQENVPVYAEDGVTAKETEVAMTQEELVAYETGRIDETVTGGVVYSETQTLGAPETGFVAAPSAPVEEPVETPSEEGAQ